MRHHAISARLLFLVATAACTSYTPATPSPPAPGSEPGGAPVAVTPGSGTPEEAKKFAEETNAGLLEVWLKSNRADWINQNFITDDTDALAGDAKDASLAYVTERIKESVRFQGVKGIDPAVARQISLLRRTDLAAPNDPKERKELADLAVAMGSAYGKGKYCSDTLAAVRERLSAPKAAGAKDGKSGKKPAKADAKPKAEEKKDNCLTLGELSKIVESGATSYDEKLEAWKGWRTISVPMRPQYQHFVELANKGARDIGYADVGELWRSRYDMSPAEMEADVERLWQQVRPLYEDLHCYVRGRLAQKYKGKMSETGTIPAHLLGNMWSQTWGNVYDDVVPYPKEASLDVTKGLEKKGYTPRKMVETGEAFFTSLGLDPLPKTFWERSLIEKPRDREVECHASAWDLTFNADVRIKMCTEVNEEDLITIHHELGHDYYFMYYHTLPVLFQDGANDGFHEGIGDTLALSVTPEYLYKLGLLDAVPANDKADMNVLMRRALDKVAFLPFGMLIDKWRWDVFSGKVKPDGYNRAWWDLVKKYQGVDAAVPRSEADFDPGAKYHIPGNVPYLRYFLADIYQFQFHRALCRAAGHKGPLYKCSIHGSKAAGERLKAMLAMGATQPWPEAMKAISGEDKADASAILEYFAPLQAYLKEQNKGKTCGW